MNDQERPGASLPSYDKDYYDHHLGDVPYARTEVKIQNHFRTAAANLVSRYSPKRVLDVGCAKGFLVEHLRDLGIDAFGIDNSEYAISEVRGDIKEFCQIRSSLDPITEKYDLVTCIEVAEHLHEHDAETLIKNLCSCTDQVIFSSTPLDYAEESHINIQPREYWVEQFARNGFYPDLRFESAFITPQAMRFVRMTRPLRVVICSRESAKWAVVRLRILDPLRELEKQGRMKVTFASAYDDQLPIEDLLAADIVVIQREFADRNNSLEIVRAMKMLGKVVVFEIDDLLTHVPRSNPVYPYSMKIAQDLIDTARDADFITASTKPLLEELAKEVFDAEQKGYVLRNCVNPEIWGSTFTPRPRREGEPLIVGWFGSPTHREDLAIVGDAIRYLTRKHKGEVEFHFFGYLPAELKEIDGVKLVRGGQANVDLHAKGVREANIDLAIAPLTNHPFNRSKSDLKWLEYSICSIPGIYSKVDPYTNSITHGVDGWIVENDTASWVEAIERLLRDDRLRSQLARNAFDVVRRNFCLDTSSNNWDDLYRAFAVSGAREKAEGDVDDIASEAAALLFRAQARRQSTNGTEIGSVASLEASMSLSPKAADDALNAAMRLIQRSRYAAAERLLLSATARAPHSIEGWLLLSRFYRHVGDPIRAEQALEGGRKADPSHFELALTHIDHLMDAQRSNEIAARLEPVVQAEFDAPGAIASAEALVRFGRPAEAQRIVRTTSARLPDVDFAPLMIALSKLQNTPPDSVGEWSPARHRRTGQEIKVAVFAAEPPTSLRVHTTLRAPLRALENLGALTVQWSDGNTEARIADWADIIVVHRAFVNSPAMARVTEVAESRGIPLVYAVEDLLFQNALNVIPRFAPEFASVIVPNERTKAIFERIVPGIGERVQIVRAMVDPDLVGNRKFRSTEGRPLAIGLFTSHARPSDLKSLTAALARLVEENPKDFTLRTWAPNYEGDTSLAASKNIGSATPFYSEFANKLAERQLDVALLPVSRDERFEALSEQVWLDLAANRIPVIASARDPFVSVIHPGRTGFMLAEDPTSWVEGIRQLRDNPRLRRDIGERSWNYVFGERLVQQNAITLGRVLRSALESQRSLELSRR